MSVLNWALEETAGAAAPESPGDATAMAVVGFETRAERPVGAKLSALATCSTIWAGEMLMAIYWAET
jgi:hypothetical protein